MICKSCKKNVATIKFTEVVDGKAVQHHLCSECYQAYQESASGFTLAVPKPAARRAQTVSSSPPDTSGVSKCPMCGMTLSHVLEFSSVGCAGCYSAFGSEIESVLEALHRGASHRGKSFAADNSRVQINKEIQAKRLLLRRMLKEENYEEAARLRDELAAMEAAARTPSTQR